MIVGDPTAKANTDSTPSFLAALPPAAAKAQSIAPAVITNTPDAPPVAPRPSSILDTGGIQIDAPSSVLASLSDAKGISILFYQDIEKIN